MRDMARMFLGRIIASSVYVSFRASVGPTPLWMTEVALWQWTGGVLG